MAIMVTSSILASFAVSPAHAVTVCSDMTVTGGYGMFPMVAPTQTSDGSGYFEFDGAGRVRGHETDVFSNGSKTLSDIKGKYKIKPNCEIKMVLTYYINGTQNTIGTFEGVVVNSGSKIDTLLTGETGNTVHPAPFVLEAVQ